jgi:uncharacterized membrane protein YeaQ/YmgE (transglycosylase-associated protein family)
VGEIGEKRVDARHANALANVLRQSGARRGRVDYLKDFSNDARQRANGKGAKMIGTILSALVVGLIVGALARLIMPGKQNIGVIMTIVLGALGSFIGTWVTYQLGYSNSNGGFEIIPFLVGIIVAIVLIAIYVGITGRRSTPVR